MGVKVTFKDKGLSGLTAKFTTLKGLDLTVGVQGRTGAKVVSGRDARGRFTSARSTNLATVAMFNEFGTRDIPARPFVRSAMFTNKTLISLKSAEVYARFVTTSATAERTLEDLGSFIASKVKERVETSIRWAKLNAPSTVEKKGSNNPLHDTGRLAKSISWGVRGPSGSIISEGAAR